MEVGQPPGSIGQKREEGREGSQVSWGVTASWSSRISGAGGEGPMEGSYSFTEETVRDYDPPLPGVYVIESSLHVICVGQSNNIRQRLLEHYKRRSDQAD